MFVGVAEVALFGDGQGIDIAVRGGLQCLVLMNGLTKDQDAILESHADLAPVAGESTHYLACGDDMGKLRPAGGIGDDGVD